jgi:hypothetical protein
VGRIDHTSAVPPPSTARLLALSLVLLVLVTGCGGHGKAAANGRATPSSSPSSSAGPALDPGAGVPKVGQCFRMTASQARASVAAPARVSCKAPHTSVVAFVGYVAKAVTPLTPVAQRRAVGKKVCEPAFRALVGGTVLDRAQSLLTWTLFTPGQRQLARGARWVRCDVLARSGDDLVPLPTTTPVLAKGVPENLRVCQTKADVDVSCAAPHVYRVAGVFLAPGTTYPGVSTEEARARCHDLTQTFGGFFQVPSQEGWNAGDKFVRCLTGQQPTAPAIPSPSS